MQSLCPRVHWGRRRGDSRQETEVSVSYLSALNERGSLGTELLDQASVHPAGLACLGFDFVPRLSFIGHLELFAPLYSRDYSRTGGSR